MSETTVRCTDCGTGFTDEQIAGRSSCPACGTEGLPMAIADDVTVNVNWHELRVLGMWAERWAAHIRAMPGGDGAQRTVAAICGRLMAQFPDRTPLTLSGELAELRDFARERGSSVDVTGFDEDQEANDDAR